MTDDPSTPPAPPPIRRRPAARAPVDITFVEPSLPAPPPPPERRSRNSLYYVQKALLSPRVLAMIAALSGWAWAGVQYVASTARQSDLDTAVLRIDALQKDLAEAKAQSTTALDVGRQCVAQQGAATLAMKAVVGNLARARGRSEQQKRNEQAAAESRYTTALTEGRQQHEAVREALED